MYHQDWTDLDEGWLYGDWETGGWLGFSTKEKAFGTYGWVCKYLFQSPYHNIWCTVNQTFQRANPTTLKHFIRQLCYCQIVL